MICNTYISWYVFQKKTQEPVVPNKLSMYEPPTIYRTNDYFKSEWIKYFIL